MKCYFLNIYDFGFIHETSTYVLRMNPELSIDSKNCIACMSGSDLFNAACYGNIERVKLLIGNKFDLNWTTGVSNKYR